MFRRHAKGNRLVDPAEGCVAMQMPAPGTFAKRLDFGLDGKNFIQANAAGLKDPLAYQDPAIVRQTGVGDDAGDILGEYRGIRDGAESRARHILPDIRGVVMAVLPGLIHMGRQNRKSCPRRRAIVGVQGAAEVFGLIFDLIVHFAFYSRNDEGRCLSPQR
jgi:hypothetical protein